MWQKIIILSRILTTLPNTFKCGINKHGQMLPRKFVNLTIVVPVQNSCVNTQSAIEATTSITIICFEQEMLHLVCKFLSHLQQ